MQSRKSSWSTACISSGWAASNSTYETFLTLPLSAGEREYSLPVGVTEVINLTDYSSGMGNANQLFTLENAMLTAGFLDFLQGSNRYSLVDYHAGLDYFQTLQKYQADEFSWKFNRHNNILTLTPVPSASNATNTYFMVQVFMREGYNIGLDNTVDGFLEDLYDDPWFYEYCVALSKIILGRIRSKFSGFDSIGNKGINLDGQELLSEGREDKERLEEQLKNDEMWEGFDISWG